MTVKIWVREGESLPAALRRLQTKCRHAYRRQWSKTRPGAYEKPSYRRRKREGLRARNARAARWHRRISRQVRCTVFLVLRQLLAREEIYQRARLPFKAQRRWKEE